MGSLVSLLTTRYRFETITQLVSRKRKRSESEETMAKAIEFAMHTPQSKKLKSTSEYIYQTLFEEGKNSDLTVEALGHQFKLHRIYLCQSPYFASMFGGAWLEYNRSYVLIDIIDPVITIESLKIVFGSLYADNITLHPTQIVSVLATATMFQLDGLIEKCREVMITTINPMSAVGYYTAACEYADRDLEKKCIDWFLVNLMTFYHYDSSLFLKTIPISLMSQLVLDSNLFVIQTEISLYVMLKFWMYMHMHPDLTSDPTICDINTYYVDRENNTPFLLTTEGKIFISVFKNLRMQHLITHHSDVETLQHDNILPRSWLRSSILNQWKVMLKVNQNEDSGPSNDIVEDYFLNNSLRCGRILNDKEKHMWRWTGFHYGIDLLMITDGNKLSIRRSHRPEYGQLLSFQSIRRLAIRVTVVTLNEQRQISFHQTTGIKCIALSKTEETLLMEFENELIFPILISVNLLFTSPTDLDR